MCLGSIVELLDAWEEDGAPLGRLADGTVVSLAFVPEARPGAHVLVHLGIPVEVLGDEAAAEALALRKGSHPGPDGGSS